MKFTIDVEPVYKPYEIKEKLQQYLKADMNAPVTSISIRFNKQWDWGINKFTIVKWAYDVGVVPEVKYYSRKEHCVFVVRRITGGSTNGN